MQNFFRSNDKRRQAGVIVIEHKVIILMIKFVNIKKDIQEPRKFVITMLLKVLFVGY